MLCVEGELDEKVLLLAMASTTLRVFPRLVDSPGVGRRTVVPVFRIKKCAIGFCSVRCNAAEDSAFESVTVRAEKTKDVDESWSSSSSADNKFNGWFNGAEVEAEKNSLKIAAMQMAAGFLLALGVSLSYYFWCQKQGRRVIPTLPTPPTLTQIQLPSFLKILSPQKREHSNYEEEDINEESEEVNGVKNSFGKQTEMNIQSEKEKVVERGDAEDNDNEDEMSFQSDSKGNAVEREDAEDSHYEEKQNAFEVKQQILNDESDDEPQRTALVTAANKALISVTHDQEKASGSAKEESQNAEDLQKQPRLSAAESVPESEKDPKKTYKGGNDEAKLAGLQPRKLRKSQRNKRKTSGRRGNVVVPPVVDRIQEQALAVLQTVKVVEEGFDPRAICNRRDYARWIIASSNTLTRSSASRVFPAMYIEGATELAFADVDPNDPDFAYIQGLAEAGLIPSKFSPTNGELGEGAYDSDSELINFFPDSPVSRLDLVNWKMALGGRSLPIIDKEGLKEKSGFLDIDQIESTSWPALSVDLESGENSIITSAFGLTRRFQPDKAATIGQAAIALTCGESSEVFSEELARFQAQRMADEAVAEDDALQAQKQKELDALFDGQLIAERQQKEQAQKLFEELKVAFDKVKEERDAEKDVLRKDKAAVEAEKEFLQHLREQVDEQLQALSMRVMQVSIEQEKLEKLRFNSEVEEKELSRLWSEVETEKQALVQARLWAEDEARKAQTHAEALEYTRKRELEPSSDGTLKEDSILARPWMKARTELEYFLQRAPSQKDIMDKGEDLKANISNALIQSWTNILRILNGFLQIVGDFFQDVRLKTLHYYHVTSSSAGNLLQDSAYFVSQKFQDLLTMLSKFLTSLGNGIKKFANECKGEVKKLSRQFKD